MTTLSTPRATAADDAVTPGTPRRPIAAGVVGAVTLLFGWVTAWLPTHPLSAFAFVLIWVGFILVLDTLVWWRRSASLLQSHPLKFWQLFVFSVPVWWLFEVLNSRVQNWHYVLDHPYGLSWSPLGFNLMASLCFSTVLPAVMEMATLVTSLPMLKPHIAPRGTTPPVPARWLALEFIAGVVSLAAPLIWPHQAFGLIWIGPLLVLDPINAWRGRRSAIGHLLAGDWRFLVAVPLAALACGFFWEMWNYFCLPKWYYTIPYVGFAKIFEMPLLGYLGYLPFGLELFALYHFLLMITRQREDALAF